MSQKMIIVGIAVAVAVGYVVYAMEKKREAAKASSVDSGLKVRLDTLRESFNAKAPSKVLTAYEAGIKAVAASGVVEAARQVGDRAPDFALTNAKGETVHLSDYLKKGPVVLTWYRGGWCPYCNLTLNALQKELANFSAAGASLLALTPELPDQSMSTAEKNGLKFEVLSDIDSNVARAYGIVYTLTDEVAKLYADKFDLVAYNGSDSNELPLAATYIIAQNGTITYAFLDADYRNRAEPSAITAELNR